MKKLVKAFVCLMMALSSFTMISLSAHAQEEEIAVFVDANLGDDAHAGTMDQPVQTLAKAQELVRSKITGMDRDVKVYIRGGTYVLDTPLTFTASDSGQNGHNVIWSAYQDEEVIISGGTSITGWTKVDENLNIWKAPSNGIDSRDLYVNGKSATLARAEIEALDDTVLKQAFIKRDNLPEDFAKVEELEIVFGRKWKWAILRIASIKKYSDDADYGNAFRFRLNDESKAAFKANLTGAAIEDDPVAMKEGMLYLQNAYELLDEPGEFYLNKEENQVYYIPRDGEDMNQVETVLGRLENLVVFDGTAENVVKNITLKGLNFKYNTFLRANLPDGLQTFQASAMTEPGNEWNREWIPTTGSAVYGEYLDHVQVNESRFEALAYTGLHLGIATKNSSITHNEFEKLGGAGIILGGTESAHHFPTPEALTQNNEITDNYINDIANTYKGCTGILVGYTSQTKVEYNTLTNLPYTGISVGWGWGYGEQTRKDENHTDEFVLGEFTLGKNIITHNYIKDVLLEPALIDGGGIYTLGRQDGSVMNDNYVDGVHNEYGGIYLDEGTVGYEITNNVVMNCVRNWLYKGDYNYIYNNYATEAQQPNRDETMMIKDELQYRFENNDIWDDAAVAAIREAAGIRPIPQPEEPTPDQPDDPTPDNPGNEDPTPDQPNQPEEPDKEFIYSLNHPESNVSIIGKFPLDTELVVDVLDNDSLRAFIKTIKDSTIVKKYNFEKVFDIYMLRNKEAYKPEGTFQVSIKLDEELLNKTLKVLYISDEGEVIEIASTVKEGNIIFSTDHNSYYAIVSEKAQRSPITNTGTQPFTNGCMIVLLIGGMMMLFTKKMEDVLD